MGGEESQAPGDWADGSLKENMNSGGRMAGSTRHPHSFLAV